MSIYNIVASTDEATVVAEYLLNIMSALKSIRARRANVSLSYN